MARAPFLTAAALGALAATAAGAQPSPYAGDRYGPAVAPASAPLGYGMAAPQAPAPQVAAWRGRMLAWPGKADRTATGAPQARAAPAAGWSAPASSAAYLRPQTMAPAQAYRAASAPPRVWTPMSRAASYAPTPQPSPRYQPPVQALAGAPTPGWRPVFASGGPASPPAPAAPYRTASGPPAAAPAYARAAPPNRAMAADRRYGYDPTQDHTVRFYSVARPFGLRPDPAPIPPQFFTATADLGASDPPGPLPVNHTTPATRAAVVGGSDAGSQ